MSQYVNLYNPALLKRRDALTARNALAAAAVSFALVTSAYVYIRSATDALSAQAQEEEAKLGQARQRLVALTKENADRRPDSSLEAELKRARVVLQQRLDVEQALAGNVLGTPTGFSEQMRAFSRRAMDGVWLTGFGMAAGGAELEISGRALDAELLPAYIRRLNDERVFQGKSFAALHIKGVAEAQVATAPSAGGKGGVQPASDKRIVPSHVEFILGSQDAAARGRP